jgi:hypothetical protein
MMMNLQQSVQSVARETQVFGEDLPQWSFLRQKSHYERTRARTWAVARWKAANNGLTFGTALTYAIVVTDAEGVDNGTRFVGL